MNVPTHDQIESVIEEIERLQADQRVTWATMSRGEQLVELEEIEWAGFTRDQELEVIGRVLAGEPEELWMRGIDTPEGRRAEMTSLDEEIRQDERAARIRDTEGEAAVTTYQERALAKPADEVDPRFLNADGSVSDRVTAGFVEWEIGKIRIHHFDDSVEPYKDGWSAIPEIEKLRLIDEGSSINDLADDEARRVLGRHVDVDLLFGDLDAALSKLRATMGQLDRDMVETQAEMDEWAASVDKTAALMDRFEQGELSMSPADAREYLLAESHRLSREIGFIGFRREFGNELAAAGNPALDEIAMELRTFWDAQANFAEFRRAHEDVGIADLIRERDTLAAIREGPELLQEEFYRRMSDGERMDRTANDNAPAQDDQSPSEFARLMDDIAVPPWYEDLERAYHESLERLDRSITGEKKADAGTRPRSDYDRLLDEAAEAGKGRAKGKEKGGIDR